MSAVMNSDPNRAFSYAVIASLVLHGLLLFGISQRERARAPDPQIPIIARLVEPAAPAPVAAAAPAQSEPAKPRPRAKPAAPKPLAREEPAPVPQTEPAAAAAAAAAASEEPPLLPMEPTAPAPAPVAPPAIASVAPAAQAPVPPAAQALADPGSLAQYRLLLISAASKYKRYPRIAMDNNWEGDVVVRMAVGANGRLAALTIQSSSGHAVLDQQALEMFKKASAAVQVPPALRGKEFVFEVRAIYNLTDQDSG
jgi:periplasmic protein TonB